MSVYRAASDGELRRYTPADVEALLAFRREMYGPASAYADPNFVRWLFESRGPRGNPSPLWLYRVGDDVVGHVAGRSVRLKIGGVEVDANWLTELVTAPAARKRGAGTALAKALSLHTPVALALEVSDAAKTVLERQGWVDLGIAPLYVRPFDVEALLRNRRAATRNALRPVGAVAYRGFDAVARALVAFGGSTLSRVDHFDERADALWAKASRSYPVAVRRDAAYLNWRFAEFPRPGFYDLHYLLRGGQVVGWTVTRSGVRYGRTTGELVDFLCEPGSIPLLLAHVLAHMRAAGAFAVYCLHLNRRARLAFRMLGFVQRRSGWAFMLHASDEITRLLPMLRDPDRWFLTAGDSNVDRPRDGTLYVDADGEAESRSSREPSNVPRVVRPP